MSELARMKAVRGALTGERPAYLWVPECRKCRSPAKGKPWRGRTLTRDGEAYVCSRCGTSERRTSQAGAAQVWADRAVARIHDLGRSVSLLASGGNRAGKSDLGAQWTLANALGRSHPWTVAWCSANQVNPEAIPDGPGTVWAISLTWGDSIRYVRGKLDLYAPKGGDWRGRWAQNEARLDLPGGGVIICKCWSQGRVGMQGDSIRAAWVDEEPKNREAWDEVQMRLVDQAGVVCLTMTPLMGLTWVYHTIVKNPPADWYVTELHGLDNPHVPPDVLREKAEAGASAFVAARLYGRWGSIEGLIWPEWDESVHVIDGFEIPATWPRVRSIDFGMRAPFCCLWGALSPDGVIYVYAEHYEPDQLVSYHAKVIHQITGGHRVAWTVADPEDKQARISLMQEHGVPNEPARKDFRATVDAVAERLKPGRTGVPGLRVFRGCAKLREEMAGYIWARGIEEPAAGLSDHAVDALRYMLLKARAPAVQVWGVDEDEEGPIRSGW